MTQGYDLAGLLLSRGKSFAEAGINPVTVWRVMKPGHRVKACTIRRIAAALEVSTETVHAAILESQRGGHHPKPTTKKAAAQRIRNPAYQSQVRA